MNKKILIPIFIIITISLTAYSFYENEIIEEKGLSENEIIEERLDQLEENKILNEQSTNPFIPKEREWIQSGSFMIDRSEYWIGEKIFINIRDLGKDSKGQMVIFKPINNTHFLKYNIINFDGSMKQNSNLYVPMVLNEKLGVCTSDQLVGDWVIGFNGIDIDPLRFKIKDSIIPGIEEQYQPIC